MPVPQPHHMAHHAPHACQPKGAASTGAASAGAAALPTQRPGHALRALVCRQAPHSWLAHTPCMLPACHAAHPSPAPACRARVGQARVEPGRRLREVAQLPAMEERRPVLEHLVQDLSAPPVLQFATQGRGGRVKRKGSAGEWVVGEARGRGEAVGRLCSEPPNILVQQHCCVPWGSGARKQGDWKRREQSRARQPALVRDPSHRPAALAHPGPPGPHLRRALPDALDGAVGAVPLVQPRRGVGVGQAVPHAPRVGHPLHDAIVLADGQHRKAPAWRGRARRPAIHRPG